MERWRGKVAIVTGASSGIGAALVKDLVHYGVQVVALARRDDRLKEIRDSLPAGQKALVHPIKCDITQEEDIKSAFAWVEKNLGGVDILVNNAGVLRMTAALKPDNSQDIKDTINTNVIGLAFCTREAYHSMKRRNVSGHIFLVNSLAGHRVPDFGPSMSSSVYAASKYAVTALTEIYRQELANAGTKIKVTSISPGPVDTEIFPGAINMIKDKVKILDPEDISESIIYALSTKPHVQVQDIILRPLAVDMPSLVKQLTTEKK
ncbi:unnamed protein product [Hermetia illucens]|uniref:Farnesol dehydrogenase n=1 Tax=Hermetia illucens TaxID=343691 RepID=A0A7R8UQM3_HERIL|nr:farnesol dehydrogenase-like [Hermetia illucens]CAD7084850.1 unnamed protein product [Hermetia illucens]